MTEEFVMSQINSNQPTVYITAGIIGLVLSVALALIAEFVVTAPNASTLFYEQSRVLGGAIILFLLSVMVLVRGFNLRAENKRLTDALKVEDKE
jgi:hypothetical protein